MEQSFWPNFIDWLYEHPEEAQKDPLLLKILSVISKKCEIEWNQFNPFKRAIFLKQLCEEMPQNILKSKMMASPLREEVLLKWHLFLDMILNKEYNTEPEIISLKKYKPTLKNYIKIISQELDGVYEEEDIKEIQNSENLFWKGLPMKEVIKHFNVLTVRKNKRGEPFLSQAQFLSFLRRGFLQDKKQPKHKINCITGEKGFIIKRFYEFFEMASSQYGHPSKKEKFIALLTDCFDNWDATSIKSYFKPKKTKETW